MMPFYHGRNNRKQLNKNTLPPFYQSLKKIVTLQVRIPQIMINTHGKRVSSDVSFRFSGSMTVEAALCLSLFIFMTVSLVVPLKLINTQRQMQAALETTGEDFSQYGYIKYQLDKKEPNVEESDSWSRELLEHLTSAAVLTYLEVQVRRSVQSKGIRSLSLTRSKILQDGETICLKADYDMVLPFPVFKIASVPASSICYRRAWIGREGGRSGEAGQGEEDETVYISRHPTCYHRSRECRYLHNHVSVIAYESLKTEKNAEGNLYQPCMVCGGKAGKGDKVYIMPSGERYHSDRYCSSIIAYIEAVPLSQVEALGACSYCGEKESVK